MRVLVIEDDSAMSGLLRLFFETEGYEVTVAGDGNEALKRIAEEGWGLILLDLNLPGCDGLDVLKQTRMSTQHIPLMVLTGRSSLEDRVACLDLGADDCLTKPFALRELSARTRSLLRRREAHPDPVLRCGDLELNRVQRSVVRGGRSIDLTSREYALAEFLLQNKGRCVPRATLLARVWNMPEQSETNVVDVYVNYLRRKPPSLTMSTSCMPPSAVTTGISHERQLPQPGARVRQPGGTRHRAL